MEQKHRNIVLVPFPLQGHITPMLQLANLLHSKGFSIVISQTLPNIPNPSDFPDFRFITTTSDLSDVQDLGDFVSVVAKLNKNCTDLLLESLYPEKRQDDVCCIIHDNVLHSAADVATELGIPSIVLNTSSANNFYWLSSFPRLKQESYVPVKDCSKLEEIMPGLDPFRFKDLFVHSTEDVDHWMDAFSATCSTKTSSAVIMNTANCLEQSTLSRIGQEYCKTPIFPIGPMHRFPLKDSNTHELSDDEKSCLSFLDKQETNSVLYVSFGTIAQMNEKDINELALGLEQSQQPFLWVIRPGSVQGSNLTEAQLIETFADKFGERCCIVKWAPQKEVLAHLSVGGFFSHCGWNSTLESLSEGVPMICRPFLGDQMGNRRCLCCVWRVGLELKKEFEKGEISRAVRVLMKDKEGEEMRERAKKLKEEIKVSVEQGGSSYDSLNELVEFIKSL